MDVQNNKKLFRFEIKLPDDEYAVLEYRWLKGSMVLMHTLVPVSARGKGIGNILVRSVLEYARAHNLKLVIYCPFVTKYLEAHHEYDDLIDPAHRK